MRAKRPSDIFPILKYQACYSSKICPQEAFLPLSLLPPTSIIYLDLFLSPCFYKQENISPQPTQVSPAMT